MEDPADLATEAAKYRYEDGTIEIVFVVEEGHVLTVREYPDEETFDENIGSATYEGQHEGVADLPSPEAFEDED